MAETIEIRPQPGPQEHFLASSADIAVYGGAAGGGKTWAGLLEPLRHICNPEFGAIVFRRTYPQITNEGALWDEASKLYPLLGAKPNKADLSWVFPSGCCVSFRHLQHEKDVHDYQGAQVALFVFDELTHFSERQFFYMLSRNRSTCGVRPYVRGMTNPDPDSWVRRLIGWWINEKTGSPIPERAGVIRWFARVNDEFLWADSWAYLHAQHPDIITPEGVHPDGNTETRIQPKSVTFIPASVYDNKALLKKDPGYLANLMALPLVEREQLLGGNWNIRPAAGKVFNRAWFGIVPVAPAGGVECLFWDFAATEKEIAKPDPDFTAPVSIRLAEGRYYVTLCEDFQGGPAEVERRFKNLSFQRSAECRLNGTRFLVRWEREPGSAGKREAPRYAQLLAGLDARAILPQGDKLIRAAAFAAQCEMGNVDLVLGSWNERYLKHMHAIPDGDHDDIMDGSSGSFNVLVKSQPQKATSRAA